MAQAQQMGYNLSGGMPMGGNNMMHGVSPQQLAQFQAMQARHMAARPVSAALADTRKHAQANTLSAAESSAGKAKSMSQLQYCGTIPRPRDLLTKTSL